MNDDNTPKEVFPTQDPRVVFSEIMGYIHLAIKTNKPNEPNN